MRRRPPSPQASSLPAWTATVLVTLLGLSAPSRAQQAQPAAAPDAAQSFTLPARPLADALAEWALQSRQQLIVQPALVSGKAAPAVAGRMTPRAALERLLVGSGLEAVPNGSAIVVRARAADSSALPALGEEASGLKLRNVVVRGKRAYDIGPLPGLGLTKEQIPGNVQSLSAEEIKQAHALSLTELMNRKLQSVNVNDYQSNPFQMDVQYRGFTASPQVGTAQGISVFLDGIRVNEPFGDVVNWDMIPLNALKSLDVFPGSNPIFGLGTLGGALSMRTRSGFDGKTLDAEILKGSFDRRQLQISAGNTNGVVAGFVSGNFFLEDGWREDSPSKVNQVFGKAEWQGDRAQLGLSMLYSGNKLTGNGLLPTQMVNQDPKQVYTSPDESKNDLLQFQLSGTADITDSFNITGQVYRRKSKRKSSTSDVNENFGGSFRPNNATVKDRSRQLLPGLPDVNGDGKPDYNNYAMNVAADANGNPLTRSGTVCTDPTDPCVNDLAFGTQFAPRDPNGNLQPIVANQATVGAADSSGTFVLNWTYDPRRQLDDINLPSNIPNVFNAPVTASYDRLVSTNFPNRGVIDATNNADFSRGVPAERFQLVSQAAHPGSGESTFSYNPILSGGFGILGGYTDQAGFFHQYWELLTPINSSQLTNRIGGTGGVFLNGTSTPVVVNADGNVISRDGKYGGEGFSETGYIEGTPTALFTDTQIDQLGTGGALQLNWNLGRHKLMVGASVDQSHSTYDSKQYLGVLDDQRHGRVDSDFLGWEYFARDAESGFALNDFGGRSITKSLFASETWAPVEAFNLTAAARFNHTVVNNQLATTQLSRVGDVNDIINILNLSTLCPDRNHDGVVDPDTECPTGLDANVVPFDPSYAAPTGSQLGSQGTLGSFRMPEKERFTYTSFNPALGATWQARNDLNIYSNWSKGARTPTVIELGCAFDNTPIGVGFDVNGNPTATRPRSLYEHRVCTLPGAMSGDPYLKQVRSTTVEAGVRGKVTADIDWNASVYRTDLKDDIYFVAVTASSSFFQNVGNTRRQGIEMGVKGKAGRATFALNYSLTDATFRSAFDLISPHNSSAGTDNRSTDEDGDPLPESNFGKIKVNRGNRLPGIPLRSFNANLSYDVTDKWRVSMNAVAHSSAFVRGNENNQHEAGPAAPILIQVPGPSSEPVTRTVSRADFGSGKTAGYTVFNFQTSFRFDSEWTLGLQVNNVFNKQYASAGRLGLNAFSPSIKGTVGPDGFNYNSSDWQGTSFLGTGAPRAAWLTVNWQFDGK